MLGATVLLVDDDEVLRQVLRRVLTRDGYNVLEAGSVAQALERGREQRPALALIDLRLPDGDGVELAQELTKQIGRFPLILMTAYPLRLRDQPDLARAFAHVLTKPLNLDELRQAIGSSLASAPSASGDAARVSAPVAKPQAAAVAPPSPPAKTSRRRWALISAVVVLVAALAVAVPALGTPALHRFLNPSAAPIAAPILDSHASLTDDQPDAIELPRDVVEKLGVTSEPLRSIVMPRTLELAGSLSFDPNHLGQVQARFPGKVIRLGEIDERDANGKWHKRTLRYEDPVTAGQVLAVVLSKELGEKKSELVDALARLWYDEAQLDKFEELVKSGSLPPVNVLNQRTIVVNDRNALDRIQLTLRTWDVPEKDIQVVRDEAKRIFERKGRRDLEKETEWAKVEVKAPFDGTIVEKNVNLNKMVSTDFTLYQVADLRKLGVLVHAYEEDLSELRKLRRGYPWKVRASADPNAPLLKSDGLQQLGLIVDPTQHTDPVMGLVQNEGGQLRVGQFIKATVELPAPPNVVSVPSSALDEDGEESVLFIQPDPSKPRYARRRVAVAMRLRDVVYIRMEPTERERKKGLQSVAPGEFVVTEGVLELQAALEDLQAKAKARK